MLIDSHLHLEQLEDADGAVSEAKDAGVTRLVCVSQDLNSMRAVLQLRERHPESIVAALGIHPVNAVQDSRQETSAALDFLAANLASADQLGEAGLDRKWADTPELQAYQEEILDRQLELATQHRKPVNLHSRRCLRQVMARAIAFHRETGLNAQLHWFTQSEKLARICNDEGIYISVGPSILYQEQSQKVATAIAEELLLLETDAPVPFGDESGHPRRIREVAEKLAELKSVSTAEVAEQTAANFSNFVGRKLE